MNPHLVAFSSFFVFIWYQLLSQCPIDEIQLCVSRPEWIISAQNSYRQSTRIKASRYSILWLTVPINLDGIWTLQQHWNDMILSRLSICMNTSVMTYASKSLIRKISQKTSTCEYQKCYTWAQNTHDDVIKWKHFPHYCIPHFPYHRSLVNSRTKASDAELWCFLWSLSE